MSDLTPRTPDELAEALASAARAGHRIQLGGRFSKRQMGGPIPECETTISTSCLGRVLQYDPRDLTISVEAGLPFAELSRLLAEHRQMIPLDPPFAGAATVGGVVATNSSGPRRRLYGTPRDMIIGMKFATVAGKVIQSGGMVVKNVAGLDTAKLLIGSFGTLAAIAVVNFKVVPMNPQSRSFLLRYESIDEAMKARQAVLGGALQPPAVDLLNPQAASLLGESGFLLLVEAAGNAPVIDRYTRELAGARTLDGVEERTLWQEVQELIPHHLGSGPEASVARVSCRLSELGSALESLNVPTVARAGSGVAYACFPDGSSAAAWAKEACARGWNAVVEFAPLSKKSGLDLWPCPGGDLEMMRRVKRMFDPNNLLNPGRLYGRI